LTVKECVTPGQVAVGVTAITAVVAAVPLLVAVKAAIVAPEPDAPSPMDVLEFVHV